MINNYIKFISNNDKGLHSLEKRIKVLEYLKNCISHNGFMFLQEMHSVVYNKKDGRMSFKENFFSHTGIAALAGSGYWFLSKHEL